MPDPAQAPDDPCIHEVPVGDPPEELRFTRFVRLNVPAEGGSSFHPAVIPNDVVIPSHFKALCRRLHLGHGLSWDEALPIARGGTPAVSQWGLVDDSLRRPPKVVEVDDPS